MRVLLLLTITWRHLEGDVYGVVVHHPASCLVLGTNEWRNPAEAPVSEDDLGVMGDLAGPVESVSARERDAAQAGHRRYMGDVGLQRVVEGDVSGVSLEGGVPADAHDDRLKAHTLAGAALGGSSNVYWPGAEVFGAVLASW